MTSDRIGEMAQRAKDAFVQLSAATLEKRNEALLAIARHIDQGRTHLLEESQLDVADAAASQLPQPLISRLKLTNEKIDRIIAGLHALSSLSDPLGETQVARELAEGLKLYRVSCPIGVIGVIFESRPDALVQISSLCLKSGNAVLLKGGSEARRSNQALYEAIVAASREVCLPDDWIGLLESREDVTAMLRQDDSIDLIIPRGSKAFVRYIMENSYIPVLGHSDGICHVYVDRAADVDMAVKLTVDSKTQSLAVCNAAETLLVHREIAASFLPKTAESLVAKGVELRGCERTRVIIPCDPATDADWATEYLDSILSIRIVDDLDEAIRHINRYGSRHTDAIVTEDSEAAKRFMTMVDSAGVYQNCTTRFADGFLYGFGAEVGIATGKLHARGPMGLEGLCTYKYKLFGNGHTLSDLNNGVYHLTHRNIDEKCPTERT